MISNRSVRLVQPDKSLAGCVVDGSEASISLIVAADVRIDRVLAYAPCNNRSYNCSFHCSMVSNRSVQPVQPDKSQRVVSLTAPKLVSH